MKLTIKIFVCLAFCLFIISTANAQKTTFLTEGTFSNIKAGDGGDYGGMQIYVTDSDGQFYVVVTVAEGVKMAPVMVKAKANIEARTLEFSLPGKPARKFMASIEAKGMKLIEIMTTKSSDGLDLTENNEQFLKRL